VRNAAKEKTDGKMFISYHRSDARCIAGRLSDTLEVYFGDERVFRDIESIEDGADFGNVIEESLQTADAVIVLIGPDWLTLQDDNGQRRIDDPEDWGAQEIAVAMQLKKPVFPVLVENASMPRTEELPEKLRPLTRYNAIPISDDRWKTDVERLAKIISFEIPSERKKALLGQIGNLPCTVYILIFDRWNTHVGCWEKWRTSLGEYSFHGYHFKLAALVVHHKFDR
jgi:hypothetical protein